MYQQCQPLVWDSHSSNLGVSEELNMVEEVKGDERKVDRAWLSGPFQSQVLGCAGGCPITSWVASQAPKSCSVPAADTWVDKPAAKGFQKHLSLGHLKGSVRPATCSPIICIPRSSRQAASSVWLRSSLFSITGLRGGSDESGTHCFILAEQASNLVCLASCPQSGPTVPSVVWGDLTWVTLGFHCPSYVLPVWPYLPLFVLVSLM